MWAQGLVVAPSSAFLHLPPGFLAQRIPQQPMPQALFSFQHMMRPHQVPYAPVQQVDDPNMWHVSGTSSLLGPPPLRPPIVMAPPHQQDDPNVFGLTDPNPPSTVVPKAPPPMQDSLNRATQTPLQLSPPLTTHGSQRNTTMLDIDRPAMAW